MAENTILDLDAMMDTAMDSVETLPDFINNPPEGNYQLKVADAKIDKYTPKAKQGEATPAKDSAARIVLQYEIEDTIQLSNKGELPVKNGSLFRESFMATEDGLKFFKKQAMNISNIQDEEELKGVKLRDLMDGLKGSSFLAKVSIRKTDDGKGGQYENVQVRPVHQAA